MRRAVWLLGVSVVTVGILLLFVFPTRTLVRQEHDIAAVRHQIAALHAENASLRAKAAALHQPATIERLAGREFGLVMPGQKAYAVLPSAGHGAQAHPGRAGASPMHHPHHHWWRALELWRDL